MKRRNFLQALGFTAMAKPSLPPVSTPTIANTLSLGAMGIAEGSSIYGGPASGGSTKDWMKRSLAKLALGNKRAEAIRKRRFWMHNLDANVASLRSVSLQHKINMSREVLYEQDKRHRKTYLEARLSGLLDDDD